jgi:hypothetical protein
MAKKWTTEYKNGAYSEVTVYKKRRKGAHVSDRIRLRIVPETGEHIDVLMHALEACDIAACLAHAAAEAIVLGLPLSSTD